MMVQLRPQLNKAKRFGAGPSVNARDSYGNEKPTFCLRYVDPDFCITSCDKNDKAAFAQRIRQLSTMTWNEIIQADRHGFGSEHIPRRSLIPRIPSHVTEDVGFIALRFSGLKPMVGYQSQGTFHIIWFDRDMKGVYNHG